MAEVYTEPTPSAFGPRPTDPGTPVPLDGDGTTTLDGIAAAFSRENYVAGAASAASAASGRGAHTARGAHRAADPTHASQAGHPVNAGSPILSVRSIEKVFGSRDSVTHALAGVSFDVAAGEFVGIMGPSGSGKTTLLNCVSTIDTVTSGHIIVGGRDITGMSKRQLAKFRRDDLGFIFQDSNLLDTLTGFENISLALTIKGEPARAIPGKVNAMAARLGESVHLARLSGDELILVACEAPQRGFHMTSETGTRLPVHASSQGKAILSAMPVYEAEALLRRRPLQVCTPHTVTAPEQLLAQLPAIRRGGYAEEHEEYRLGLKSVAAPIYEGDGPCRYAIGVICIAGTPAAEFASMRAAVMETAQNLSALLGHRAPGGI